jgi:hypothetical protein
VNAAGPAPPPDLASRRLPLQKLAPETALWRVHDQRRDAIWFGPALGREAYGRFDAPRGEFRVCCVGLSPEASFAETFLRNPGRRILDRTLLDFRAITTLKTRRPLSLVRLYGPGLARLGATAEIALGPAYEITRQWSLALWSHAARVDGILYKSRHDDDEVCIALFDRAQDALVIESSERILSSRLLPSLLSRYRVGFDPRG